MRRTIHGCALALLVLALSTPVALAAEGHDGGEGLWGETSDKIVTNAGFITIAFFPLLVFVLSIIQWRLDKRKAARMAAEKARRGRADLRGGW
jgi:hypothetical protein